MVIAAIENFILLGALFAVVCFGLAWTTRRVAQRGRWRLQPHTVARVYTAAVVFPALAAAWLVAAALLPESWLGEVSFEAAHTAPLHRLHLLGDLTAAIEPMLAYVTVTLTAAAAVFSASLSLRGYRRIGGAIERLEMNATPPSEEQLGLVKRVAAQRDLDAALVMSDYPFSFVWGFARSKLVLSSGLLQALTLEELTGVLEHEAAHHVRRDNLVKLALVFCGHLSLAFPLARIILRWRAEQIEMICDEVAAAHTSGPLEVASALVKLRRRTLAACGCPAHSFASSFIPDDSSFFEQRVLRVIALADTPPSPARAQALAHRSRDRVFFLAAAFVLSLIAVSALAPLAVHRAAESVIHSIR